MKKISVIVPVYQVYPYLRQCLESIIGQTYQNLEIIVVNDGSDDGSELICKEFAEKEPRILLISQTNQGTVMARKNGIQQATGDFIGFVDGDDWIEATMFQEMAEVLEEHNELGFVTIPDIMEFPQRSLVKHRGKQGVYSFDSPERKGFRDFLSVDTKCNQQFLSRTLWSKLFRANYVQKFHQNIPSSLKFGEDVCFLWSMYPFVQHYFVLDRPLYHYRQRDTSATYSFRYSNLLDTLTTCQHLNRVYQDHPDKNTLNPLLKRHYQVEMSRWMLQLSPFSGSLLRKGYPVPFELFSLGTKRRIEKIPLLFQCLQKEVGEIVSTPPKNMEETHPMLSFIAEIQNESTKNEADLLSLQKRYFEGMLDLIQEYSPFSDSLEETKEAYFVYDQDLTPQKVVIYAMGDVGKSYYHQILRSPLTVVALVDQGKSGEFYDGMEILSANALLNLEFDVILLAVYEESMAKGIMQYLHEILAVPLEKIKWKAPVNVADI